MHRKSPPPRLLQNLRPLVTAKQSPPSGTLTLQTSLPGAAKSESPLRLFASKDEGIEAVRNGEIDTLFVLPADYVESGRIEDYWNDPRQGSAMGQQWGRREIFQVIPEGCLDLRPPIPTFGGPSIRYGLFRTV